MSVTGDPTRSPATYPFADQLQLSPHTRLRACGAATAELWIQHRYVSDITELISQPLYNGKIRNAHGVDDKGNAEFARRFLEEEYNLRRNVLLVNCSNSRSAQKKPGHSRINRIEASVVMEILKKLIERQVSPSSIGIATPYIAQRDVLVNGLKYLQSQYLTQDLSGILVETFLGFQGNERQIMILDICITDNWGFLGHGQQVTVGFTRARSLLVCVANSSNLRSLPSPPRDDSQSALSSSDSPFPRPSLHDLLREFGDMGCIRYRADADVKSEYRGFIPGQPPRQGSSRRDSD